jgi:hypothetical protein
VVVVTARRTPTWLLKMPGHRAQCVLQRRPHRHRIADERGIFHVSIAKPVDDLCAGWQAARLVIETGRGRGRFDAEEFRPVEDEAAPAAAVPRQSHPGARQSQDLALQCLHARRRRAAAQARRRLELQVEASAEGIEAQLTPAGDGAARRRARRRHLDGRDALHRTDAQACCLHRGHENRGSREEQAEAKLVRTVFERCQSRPALLWCERVSTLWRDVRRQGFAARMIVARKVQS